MKATFYLFEISLTFAIVTELDDWYNCNFWAEAIGTGVPRGDGEETGVPYDKDLVSASFPQVHRSFTGCIKGFLKAENCF